VGGWQETSRLPEIQAQITAVTARAFGHLNGLLGWSRLLQADEAELAGFRQEMRDLEAVNAKRDLSFSDLWPDRAPCIGPMCFSPLCLRLSRVGECWVHEEKWKHAIKPPPADEA
jgi:hypothetical protein